MLGLTHVINRDGLVDQRFIDERTEGFEAAQELALVHARGGRGDYRRAGGGSRGGRAIYGQAENGSFIWGLGVTEHKYGSEVVQLICNVAMMTGKLGRPGSALLPLRGQNNVQGSSDMGALPDTYTAYRSVGDEDVAQRSRTRWGVELSREKGYTIPQMFDAAVDGRLKAMYIFGEDVAQTDPDTKHVVAALETLDFLVCQDIFETETTRFADVVLPASSFLEKPGRSPTPSAGSSWCRRRSSRRARRRPTSRSSSWCRGRSATRFRSRRPPMRWDEVAALTPHFAGVSYDRLGRRGLQWPVDADGVDAPILYEQTFLRPGGEASLRSRRCRTRRRAMRSARSSR